MEPTESAVDEWDAAPVRKNMSFTEWYNTGTPSNPFSTETSVSGHHQPLPEPEEKEVGPEEEEEGEEEKEPDEDSKQPLKFNRQLRTPSRVKNILRIAQACCFGLFVALVIMSACGWVFVKYLESRHESRAEIDRATVLPVDRVKVFQLLYTRLPPKYFSSDIDYEVAKLESSLSTTDSYRDALQLREDLNGDDLDDYHERNGFFKVYGIQEAKSLIETGVPLEQVLAGFASGINDAGDMYNRRTLEVEDLPESTEFSLADCHQFTQFTPISNELRYKKTCWDVLYQHLLRTQFTPQKMFRDFVEYQHKNNPAFATDSAFENARAALRAKDERLAVERKNALRATVLSDDQAALEWLMYEKNKADFQCTCSETMGFVDKFVFICNPTPAEDKCVLLISPKINKLNSTLLHPGYHNPYTDYLAIKTRPDVNAVYRAFEAELDIRDSGALVGKRTINVTYYDLPSEESMIRYYGKTHGNAFTSYSNVIGRHQELRTNRNQNMFFRALDTVRDFFYKPKIDHRAIQDIVYIRENISLANAQRVERLLDELDGKAVAQQQQQQQQQQDKQHLAWQWAKNIKNVFVGGTLKCESALKSIPSIQTATDNELKGLGADCLKELLQRPRIVEQKSVLFSGNAAACILHCNRLSSILDAKRLQNFRFAAGKDDSDVNELLNRLNGKNAYVGKI